MPSKFKNKKKTNKARNRQKIKNSQSQPKIYWFLLKQRVFNIHLLMSIVDNSSNNLHIFSLSRQQT